MMNKSPLNFALIILLTILFLWTLNGLIVDIYELDPHMNKTPYNKFLTYAVPLGLAGCLLKNIS